MSKGKKRAKPLAFVCVCCYWFKTEHPSGKPPCQEQGIKPYKSGCKWWKPYGEPNKELGEILTTIEDLDLEELEIVLWKLKKQAKKLNGSNEAGMQKGDVVAFFLHGKKDFGKVFCVTKTHIKCISNKGVRHVLLIKSVKKVTKK